jgi:hypothetical protein
LCASYASTPSFQTLQSPGLVYTGTGYSCTAACEELGLPVNNGSSVFITSSARLEAAFAALGFDAQVECSGDIRPGMGTFAPASKSGAPIFLL